MSCSSVELAPNADSIEGSATLTFVRSRIVSPATATHTQYARQRFASVSGIDCVGVGCDIPSTLRPGAVANGGRADEERPAPVVDAGRRSGPRGIRTPDLLIANETRY